MDISRLKIIGVWLILGLKHACLKLRTIAGSPTPIDILRNRYFENFANFLTKDDANIHFNLNCM